MPSLQWPGRALASAHGCPWDDLRGGARRRTCTQAAREGNSNTSSSPVKSRAASWRSLLARTPDLVSRAPPGQSDGMRKRVHRARNLGGSAILARISRRLSGSATMSRDMKSPTNISAPPPTRSSPSRASSRACADPSSATRAGLQSRSCTCTVCICASASERRKSHSHDLPAETRPRAPASVPRRRRRRARAPLWSGGERQAQRRRTRGARTARACRAQGAGRGCASRRSTT